MNSDSGPSKQVGAAAASAAASAGGEDEIRSIRDQIAKHGEDIRALRAKGTEADLAAAAVALEAILALKAKFQALTGEEYRSKSAKRKGAVDEATAAASAAARRPKQPKLTKAQMRDPQAADGGGGAPPDPMALPPGPETFPAWSPRDFFRFEVIHRSAKPGSRARVGRITTPHGVIETPAFVPVGTNAALKCLDERHARDADVRLMFCNTYHLLVHPGPDVVAGAGGLHTWMDHRGALITDSGGFQVFSLSEPSADDGPEMKCKNKTRTKRGADAGGANGADGAGGGGNAASLLSVSEHGAFFRSYHDGRTIELTPESSVAAQKALGADIIIPLDELPPYHISRERLHASVRLSHRWMARSLRAHLADQRQQAMYAVVHGGTDEEYRAESAAYLGSLPFDGFAIGGSLGKDRAEMLELLRFLMPKLPDAKPNHLLGIADPESAEAVVPFGIDTMDSCNPTRIARHGLLLTRAGPLKIKQLKFEQDYGPIDPSVETIRHSRSYVHHLFKQHEPLFMTLASQHNLLFMNWLMADLRRRILNDEV